MSSESDQQLKPTQPCPQPLSYFGGGCWTHFLKLQLKQWCLQTLADLRMQSICVNFVCAAYVCVCECPACERACEKRTYINLFIWCKMKHERAGAYVINLITWKQKNGNMPGKHPTALRCIGNFKSMGIEVIKVVPVCVGLNYFE